MNNYMIVFFALGLLEVFASQSFFLLGLGLVSAIICYGFDLSLPYIQQVGMPTIFGLVFVITIVLGQIAHLKQKQKKIS